MSVLTPVLPVPSSAPLELAEALEAEKRRRGGSLNQMVLDLLASGLGVALPAHRSNGLGRLAGTWTAQDLAGFEAAVATTKEID